MGQPILRRRSIGRGPWVSAARRLVPVLLGAILVTNIVGLGSLAGSPSIGARLREDGAIVRVVDVEPDGPAARAGVGESDTVVSVCGEPARPDFFFADPDHISTWAGQDEFLRFMGRCRGPRIELEWKAGRTRRTVLEAEPLGWTRALWRSWTMLVVAWSFGLVSWRIWLGRDNLATRVNLLGGLFACLGLSQLAFFQVRDISIAPEIMGWQLPLNYVGAQATEFSASSVALALPRPLGLLGTVPWLVWVPWIAAAVQAVLHFGRFLPRPLWTTYLTGSLSLGIAAGVFAFRYVRERDALVRSQFKWIALSFAVGALPIVAFTQIPIAAGFAPLLPENVTILFTGFIPVGFAFAITRYRLLDIGSLLDSFVVHLSVLVVMACLEAGLLGWIENRMSSGDPARRSALFVATMLLLVFLYAPLRTWISRLLARLLGRSRPSAEAAVEGLLDRANLLGDAHLALERSLAWTLRPGSIRWLRPGEGSDPALHALAGTRGCLGQELPEVPESEAADLWVPVREQGVTSALVLVPDVGRGWRRADRDLASLVARAAEPLLESQGLKREREALQQEMHDGLGNQLYGLNLLSQDARSVPVEILRARMERIRSTSLDAIESLRTGLNILSEPTGAFGPALAKLLLRAEDHLESAGIRLRSRVDDEVAELSLDGRHAFAFLRALQEGLGNVARHSSASVAVVDVALRDGRLRALVEDDGSGFDPSATAPGLGLGNIRRRLSEAGGSGTVRSVPAGGTVLELELPLRR